MKKNLLAATLLASTTALFAKPSALAQEVLKEMKPIPVVGKYKHYLKPYAMMSKKVTYAQMKQFFEKKRVHMNDKIQKETFKTNKETNFPVRANYYQAKAFCHYIGEQTGKNITLPTERQWVYAAMAGPKRYKYPTNNGKIQPGVNIISPAKAANSINGNEVAKFPSNPFGIYGLAGNGIEWTKSIYLQKAKKLYFITKGGNLSDIEQNDYSSSSVLSKSFASPTDWPITFRCVENLEKSEKNKTMKK